MNATLESQPTDPFGIVGVSDSIRKLRRTITRAARTSYPVFIVGETGSGKELVARAIHAQSPRASGPFIAVCSGAISTNLSESVLFGHTRGAFSGAHETTPGLFRAAKKGTLFLDDVDTMEPKVQPCLLRVLETGEIRPVGSTNITHVDVRIISATNAHPRRLIHRAELRPDLFYRLSVITIHVPPLRERLDDVTLLVDHALRLVANETATPVRAVTPQALETLRSYPWPGNVRELLSAIRQACMESPRSILSSRCFAFLRKATKLTGHGIISLREYALNVIREQGGVILWKEMSEALGVSRKTLWQWRRDLAPRTSGNGSRAERRP